MTNFLRSLGLGFAAFLAVARSAGTGFFAVLLATTTLFFAVLLATTTLFFAAFFLAGAVFLLVNFLTAGEGLRLATILAPRVLKDQPPKISAEH
ncbi:hypothetical protein N9V40_01975 [Pseudomonadales bacterium]|nr:hypothetical protein [Pseudomonadales bacterium]